MASYSWISIIALFSYLFLMMAFLVAKKTRIINSFIMFLGCMILATGGSFFMRIQFWPSVNFWHYVSLLGILMVPCMFFRFFLDFLEEKRGHGRLFWVIFFGAAYIINMFTEVFIPTPIIQEGINGQMTFTYNYGWTTIIPFAGAFAIVFECVRLFVRYCKGDSLIIRQLRPILIGIGILVVGTALSTFSMAAGIPLDIISSVVFAYMVFYALYKKRLFKLSMLASPANCYIVAILITAAIYYNLVEPMMSYLTSSAKLSDHIAILIIALILLATIYVLYLIMKKFLDVLFVKEEQAQADMINRFSYAVSKTLNKEEILTELIEVIQKVSAPEKAYICLRNQNGEYAVEQAMSALHQDGFLMRSDHPLVQYLASHDSCVLMEDFCCTMEYRSMWENEKQDLKEKEARCFVAMKDSDELIGVAILSGKQKGKAYTYDDFSMLTSVCSIASMAVKNSILYEKAYDEARKDELTGLFNRKVFYETVAQQMSESDEKSVALVYMNVDDFKLYNQLYGNKEGDVALQRIANIISATSEGQGIAFRLTGKEYALILPGFDVYSAKVLAETIMDQVRKMNSTSELYNLKMLTMSCGISAAPYMASSAEELIANADFAVYSAKRSGKNKAVVYSEAVESEEQKNEKSSSYDTYASTIFALTATIDTKDHYTFQHSQNVAYYASSLAKACGMNQEFVDIIKEVGLLHDIGKIGIREDILNKPGKLTAEEYDIMKTHVENSVGIIRHLPSLDYVIPAVISHHERYDGTGYPRGSAGEDIPLMGRMLCIADSFDAMISKRSYKKAMSVSRALEIIEEEKGKQFDPKLADIFINIVKSGELGIVEPCENQTA